MLKWNPPRMQRCFLCRQNNAKQDLEVKGAVSYFTHMLLRITNLKALGQRFQV